MTPSISLAMGACNGGRFLKAQLESLANQTVLPAELVISDDASTDDTVSLIEAFQSRAPFPIKLIRNDTRLGYRENFMRIAEACQSDIIAFCDQDDVWRKDKISKVCEAFNRDDILLVYHAAEVTDENLATLGVLGDRAATNMDNPPHSLDPWSYGLGFTLSFRRSLVKLTEFWPRSIDYNDPSEREAHDQWYFFLGQSLGSIIYLSAPLVSYRQHGTNAYGWEKPSPRFIEYLRNLAKTSKADLRLREQIAKNRSEILSLLKGSVEGVQAKNAEIGAHGYKMLATRYSARAALYNRKALPLRLTALWRLRMAGVYAPKGSDWGAGSKAFLRDFFCTLFRPLGF